MRTRHTNNAKFIVGILLLLSLGFSGSAFSNQACEIYQPADNGCSLPDKVAFLDKAPWIEASRACSLHDTCYSTVGNSKQYCDLKFAEHLIQDCDTLHLVPSVAQHQETKCKIKISWSGLKCVAQKAADHIIRGTEFVIRNGVKYTVLAGTGGNTYAACLTQSATYVTAVAASGDARVQFRNGQARAVNHLVGSANRYKLRGGNNTTDVDCVDSTDLQVFNDGRWQLQTSTIFNHIKGRPAGDMEWSIMKSARSSNPNNWHYDVANGLKDGSYQRLVDEAESEGTDWNRLAAEAVIEKAKLDVDLDQLAADEILLFISQVVEGPKYALTVAIQ